MIRAVLFIVLLWPMLALAQSNRTPLDLDSNQWQKASEGVEYIENLEEEEQVEEEEAPKPRPNIGSNFNAEWLQYLIYGLVITLLLILVIMIILRTNQPVQIKKERVEATSLEEAEENLPDVELQNFYEESVEKGELKIALRVKFLMVLQALIDQDIIIWKKRKTNHEYEQELDEGEVKSNFIEVVKVFEATWYGNKSIERSEFDIIVAQIDQLLSRINER